MIFGHKSVQRQLQTRMSNTRTARYAAGMPTNLTRCSATTLNRKEEQKSLPRWPLSLTRTSAATRLLGLRIRIRQEEWVFVSCECRVLHVVCCVKSYSVRVCVTECDHAQQ